MPKTKVFGNKRKTMTPTVLIVFFESRKFGLFMLWKETHHAFGKIVILLFKLRTYEISRLLSNFGKIS